jgi:hypothetical protein
MSWFRGRHARGVRPQRPGVASLVASPTSELHILDFCPDDPARLRRPIACASSVFDLTPGESDDLPKGAPLRFYPFRTAFNL